MLAHRVCEPGYKYQLISLDYPPPLFRIGREQGGIHPIFSNLAKIVDFWRFQAFFPDRTKTKGINPNGGINPRIPVDISEPQGSVSLPIQ